jgi:hypothetical protein
MGHRQGKGAAAVEIGLGAGSELGSFLFFSSLLFSSSLILLILSLSFFSIWFCPVLLLVSFFLFGRRDGMVADERIGAAVVIDEVVVFGCTVEGVGMAGLGKAAVLHCEVMMLL